MPELPEVETIRRGLSGHVPGRRLVGVIARRGDLRLPIPIQELQAHAVGREITGLGRRGKYLILDLSGVAVILHLGMSGVLRLLPTATPPQAHDHVDFLLSDGLCLRFHDPRRFGVVAWGGAHPEQHPLLAALGPEPLTRAFSGPVLVRALAGRSAGIRSLVMDNRVVVGVGNIYASESLFRAGLHPARPGGTLTPRQCGSVARAIKAVLQAAIDQGGTTLRDFQHHDGKPGYFAQSLQVYGREGLPCLHCGHPIKRLRQGGRGAFFCPHCQPEP